MKIIEKKLSELKPYENNPRRNEDAVEYVANSIKKFGFKVPMVIDKDNVIVTGHTRYLACKQLGIEDVPCVLADDLSEEDIKAFRLADNKVGEIASWDNKLLGIEIEGIKLDLEMFGFEGTDLDGIDEIEEKPEVEFTEVLGEEHNYIVLYFDNEVDWIQMESLIGVDEKKNLSTRKDGKVTKGMERKSVGRVFKGTEVLERLREQYENIG